MYIIYTEFSPVQSLVGCGGQKGRNTPWLESGNSQGNNRKHNYLSSWDHSATIFEVLTFYVSTRPMIVIVYLSVS